MNRRINFLREDARAYSRSLSVGLIVGGVLAIAISMPNWYGLIPVIVGFALRLHGCFTIEEIN